MAIELEKMTEKADLLERTRREFIEEAKGSPTDDPVDIRSIKSIRIGARDYQFTMPALHQSDATFNALSGDITYSTNEIRVGGWMSHQATAETILHEVVHGILYAAGDDEHDETLVRKVAHGVMQVIRDNPKLIRYIQEVTGGVR